MAYSRKFLLLIITASFSLLGNAQKIWEDPKYGTDSVSRMECAKNLSIMNEFVRVKNYNDAFNGWKVAYVNCPGSSKNIYIYGERILEHKIKNATTDQEKQEFIDSLMNMYDARIKHFGQEAFVLGKKGIDLIKFSPDELMKGYEILSKSIELGKEKTSESVFVTFIQASLRLYNSGEIESDVFIQDYLTAIENLENDPRRNSRTDKAIETVENVFAESGAADCETLSNIFTPKYEADSGNVELLKKITTIMGDEDCQQQPLYARASESLYAIEPSAEAAYNLARLFKSQNKSDKAIEYYQKAIDGQDNNEVKAEYYLEFASFHLNALSNKQEARKNALKALELNPNMGLAYILIGNAYAGSSSQCGSNAVEKGSVYWAAVDKYQKAKSVDPSVADRANKLIDQYKKYFPNQEEAFFHGLTDGGSYTVGCWINESTTVRTTK